MSVVGSDNDSVVGDAVALPPRAGLVEEGPPCVCWIVARTGAGAGHGLEARVDRPWTLAQLTPGLVVGVALARQWRFARLGTEDSGAAHRCLREEALRKSRKCRERFGFIETPVSSVFELVEPCQADQLGPPAAAVLRLADTRVTTIVEPMVELSLREAVAIAQLDPPVAIAQLDPQVAHAVLTSACGCVSVVAVTGRVHRDRLLFPGRPRWEVVGAFIRSVRGALRAGQVEDFVPPAWRHAMCDPEVMLEWLEMSAMLKDIRRANEGAAIFARIFARKAGVAAADLLCQLDVINVETLRKCRCRADVAAMAVWRHVFDQVVRSDMASVSIYLFADASPQWRGVEVFASSMDLHVNGVFERRLLPCIYLRRGLLDTVGKAVGLCWQIWLLVGPSYHNFRAFCRRVRSLTTDQGTERLICDIANFSKDFFEVAFPKVKGLPSYDEDDEELFPNAWVCPGWKHIVDGLLKTTFSSRSFFPSWLLGLKAVVAFFRVRLSRDAVVAQLRQNGAGPLGELLGASRLTSIAEWRWNTLAAACAALDPLLEGLSQHFDPAPFGNARDLATLRKVTGALRSAAWRSRFQFIMWVSTLTARLSQWGSGCRCHESELKDGANVECSAKGRRLSEAWDHAMSELRSAMDEANQWEQNFWGGSQEDWREMVASVRGLFLLASRKLGHLNELPYLLARLEQPGVAARVRDLWVARQAADHHRVTRRFMTKFAADLALIQPDGSGISPAIRLELDAMNGTPLDDSVAEGPHAMVSRHCQHSRNASWGWIASTTRLQQNIKDLKELPSVAGVSLDSLWCRHKSLLQMPGSKRPHANVKMKDSKFYRNIYAMGLFPGRRPGDAGGGDRDAGGDGPGGDDGDDEPGDGDGGDGPDREDEGEDMGDGSDEDGDDPGGDEQPKGPPRLIARLRSDRDVQLMRQWLASCLQASHYYSVKISDDSDAQPSLFVFQLLALETKPILVRTHEEPEETGLFQVSVQPLELWSRELAPSRGYGDLNVFVLSDPCLWDVLRLTGDWMMERSRWQTWVPKLSDVEDCVTLHCHEDLRSPVALHSPACPILLLLDALAASDILPHAGKTRHDATSAAVYDDRYIMRSRRYLQCVLSLQELLRCGVSGFDSGRSQAYYELLLRTKKDVDPSVSAKECKRQLVSLDGDPIRLAALDRALAPAVKPRVVAAPGSVPAAPPMPEAGSVAGDESPASVPMEASSTSSSSSSSSSSSASEDNVAGDAMPVGEPWPAALRGQALKFVKGRHDKSWSYHDRLQVTCSNEGHVGCKRSRSVVMDIGEFGRSAPMLFLQAWLAKAHLPQAEHRRFVPSKADMRAELPNASRTKGITCELLLAPLVEISKGSIVVVV